MAELKLHSKRGHLKAATLIESLVGLVIIMGCFAVSLMIFEQVLHGSNSHAELKATLELRNHLLGADYESELLIENEQETYGNSTALLLVTYSAIGLDGKTIKTWQTLKPASYE